LPRGHSPLRSRPRRSWEEEKSGLLAQIEALRREAKGGRRAGGRSGDEAGGGGGDGLSGPESDALRRELYDAREKEVRRFRFTVSGLASRELARVLTRRLLVPACAR
jgi:hypothetical protein